MCQMSVQVSLVALAAVLLLYCWLGAALVCDWLQHVSILKQVYVSK
jgi:hypothetical protein